MASGDILQVEAPSSPRILAENMWAVWVNRLATSPGADDSAAGVYVVYDCCLHHLSLIQPYASKRFISRLHEAIKDLLQVSDALEDELRLVS